MSTKPQYSVKTAKEEKEEEEEEKTTQKNLGVF